MTNLFSQEDGSCQCGGHAVLRRNSKTGNEFYGCSNWPRCKSTQNRYPIVSGNLLISGDELLELAGEAALHDKDWW